MQPERALGEMKVQTMIAADDVGPNIVLQSTIKADHAFLPLRLAFPFLI